MLKENANYTFEEVLPKLLKIELFSDFAEDNETNRRIMQLVFENFKVKSFREGQEIIKEGEFGELFYILYSGSVAVFQSTFDGDQIALARLSSEMNVFFGENALISKDPRTATIIATSDCKTITLSGKAFTKICEQEPLFGYKVLLHLSRRMSNSIKTGNTDKAILYEALFNEIANE